MTQVGSARDAAGRCPAGLFAAMAARLRVAAAGVRRDGVPGQTRTAAELAGSVATTGTGRAKVSAVS